MADNAEIDGIVRLDRYTIQMDGERIRATPDQERVLHGMNADARERFLRVMGVRR